MSTPGPFEGMPFFGDMARMFQQAGQEPVNWAMARQIAVWMATEGAPEANVDPAVRIRIEELARVAELHVGSLTGLPLGPTGRAPLLRVTRRGEWASTALDHYRPLFERLVTSLGQVTLGDLDLGPLGDAGELERAEDLPDELKALRGLMGGADPSQFLSQMMQAIAPMMAGMQLGLVAGHLARRAFGPYDLPLPRPAQAELPVAAENVDEFARDWSLPPDDVHLWVCISALAHHAVLSRPHVRDALEALLVEHVSSFRADPNALTERLGGLDPTDEASWAEVFGDPEALYGSIESEEQRRLMPRIEALSLVVEGYVDWVLDEIGGKLIASYGPLTEALRRRRVEANQGDRFVERLFGLRLGQREYDRGARFVEGVVERAGADALARLWSDPEHLPTPAELDAPGLWWERINLPR